MTTRTRKTPAERKAELLDAAVELAAKLGTINVTRIGVAKATNTTDGLVNRYFGGVAGLHRAINAAAKKRGTTLPDKKQAEEIGRELRRRSQPVSAAEGFTSIKPVARKTATFAPKPGTRPQSL